MRIGRRALAGEYGGDAVAKPVVLEDKEQGQHPDDVPHTEAVVCGWLSCIQQHGQPWHT